MRTQFLLKRNRYLEFLDTYNTNIFWKTDFLEFFLKENTCKKFKENLTIASSQIFLLFFMGKLNQKSSIQENP